MERGVASFTYEDLTLEYSITGEGEPILYLHGGHSNCLEQLGLEELVEQGYSVIIPSRAGYGHTSKRIGKSLETACSFYIELLNELHIEKVHVIAASTGGPSGIYLASHYPERVKTFTLQGAVTKPWKESRKRDALISRFLFYPYVEKFVWKGVSSLARFSPDIAFKTIAPIYSKLPYEEIKARTLSRDWYLFDRMTEFQRSRHGFLIDMHQIRRSLEEELDSIQAPTLIVHSVNDAIVPLEHAEYAKGHIQTAKLCCLNTWGHLLSLGKGSEEHNNEVIGFLNQHSA
ncbi:MULTISPECIES: alpha/beta fold hydrolase [Shouchella]|uniref:Alpha/beta hydrolase n=1 Tax=Shouchella hunanensis TaxID=766894 RepID=A0ABY7WAA9_9BACI|nr:MULTISPECIES: alpha/beta hydrolase [Shouchella]WDF05616.1 alpha/beta hydrolase [Shouchella hunanensis]GAF21594.1 aromatic hydrocarbon catabolism protein [Bacillus sp. JCM 19047]